MAFMKESTVQAAKHTDDFCDVVGDGTPLVLVHGVGGSREIWRPLSAHLVDHFTIITYDLRGSGRNLSDDPLSVKRGFKISEILSYG